MSEPRLPLPIRWIERQTPPELHDYVLGDLHEEYGRRARTSRLRAWLWAAGQAVRFRAGPLGRAARDIEGRWGGARPSAMARTKGGGVEMWLRDLKYAARRLTKSPGFTLIAVVSLALGTGANTAVFTLFSEFLMGDPGVREPERVVRVYRHVGDQPYWRTSWDDYRRIVQTGPESFDAVGTWRETLVRMDATGDATVPAALVSGDIFGALGARMHMGRGFLVGQETDVPGAPVAAVVSYRFWQDHLGADPDAVGRTLRVDGVPVTLVGVAEPDFHGFAASVPFHVWVPDTGAVENSGNDNVYISARMAPGATEAEVRAILDRVAEAVNADRAPGLAPRRYTVLPRTEIRLDPQVDRFASTFTLLLFGVVGMVLLVTCMNLASFQLARTADRSRDFAVRRAVGAGSGRLTRQVLVEALLLGVVGSLAGVVVAWAGLRMLLSIDVPLGEFIRIDPSPDPAILGFSIAIGIGAGVLFGLLPALRAARVPVAETLRSDATSVIGGSAGGLRGALVTLQVAVTLGLLITAGLFGRSLQRSMAVDPGFERGGIAAVTVDPGSSGMDSTQVRRTFEEVLRRAEAVPGVDRAALATRVPLELSNWYLRLRAAGQELPEGVDGRSVELSLVTPGYFELMGMELQQGREFTESDAAPDAQQVLIVNRALADELWPDVSDPVGRMVVLPSRQDAEARVVGVVATHKVETIGEPPTPYVYRPLFQTSQTSARILATGPGVEGPLPEQLAAAARSVAPDLYVHTPTTVESITDTVFFLPRTAAVLFLVFGGLALVIASLGVWGLVRYSISRREREIGIRLALGSSGANIVRTMMRSGARPTITGAAVGVALGVGAGMAMEGFLFRVSAWDPLTLIALPALLIGVALTAAWLPARRAARIDPMTSLKRD